MNPSILMYAMQALNAIPALITAGTSVMDLINHTNQAVDAMKKENRDPTAEEWMAQAEVIAGLRAKLHAA